MGITTDKIRNVAIVGHGGTGKTTLMETLLFRGSVIDKTETVESGKTVSDYTEEEIKRKISIHTSAANMIWKDIKINLLDTPGSADFIGEVVSAFRAVDTAIMLIAADSGVQIETLKLWRRLNHRNMPRIAFINQLEKERSDFSAVVAELKEKFKKTFIPMTIPIGQGTDYKGIINLLDMKAYFYTDGKDEKEGEIPSEMQDQADAARLSLIETAAEGDDGLTEKYFEEGTLNDEDIKKGLREGMAANKFVPLMCGSGLINSGIGELLDYIAYEVPSPAGQSEPCEGGGEKTVSPDGDFSAITFKTSIDQFSGKLSFTKVITGSLKGGMEVINSDTEKSEKISKIYTICGKKLKETSEACAGDIVILTKLDNVHTNTTLRTAREDFKFEHLHMPHPVFSVAIDAASKKDQDKLTEQLNRVAEEDPTFEINFNKETKETVISGMGEMQINMILDRIREKQKIEMETQVPKVAYRETINKPAEAEYTHKKQSGGHGQYGRVVMKIKPLERGQKFEFTNSIKGGAISKGYMPGIEKGILEAMEEGFLAGYPLVDVGAEIIDGKEHPVDSSEMAFKLAGKGALKAAVEKANPTLLEPVMDLTVFIEDQYVGDVLSDLSSKRGRVMGQEQVGTGMAEIRAQVPQAEMLTYAIDLRSITSGTGAFELEFSHYNPISGKIADDVINKRKAEVEA